MFLFYSGYFCNLLLYNGIFKKFERKQSVALERIWIPAGSFSNGVTFWRCRYYRSLKCRSSLRTENDKVIQEPINHSHDSCSQKARAKVLQEQMKDKMTALSATNRNVIKWCEFWRFITYLPKKINIFVRWTSLYMLLFWFTVALQSKHK